MKMPRFQLSRSDDEIDHKSDFVSDSRDLARAKLTTIRSVSDSIRHINKKPIPISRSTSARRREIRAEKKGKRKQKAKKNKVITSARCITHNV